MKTFTKCPCNWDTCQELQNISIKSNDIWSGRFQLKLNKKSDKNLTCRKFAFKHLKISKDYEDKKLHIAKHHWSREVVTFIIEKKKNITTPISAADSKILGLNDVFDKNASVKKYVLSPTNTKSLVNSYFNIFLSPKSSSQRAQNKLVTNLKNKVALDAFIKFQAHVKKVLHKKKEKEISSVFFKKK